MLLMMFSLLGIYWLVGLIVTKLRTEGSRHLVVEEERGFIPAGSQVRVEFSMTSTKLFPAPYVIVREVLNRQTGESWAFEESVTPKQSAGRKLVYHTPPLERGIYTFEDTQLVYEDIFGLVEHRRILQVPGSFKVMPRIAHIHRWDILNSGLQRSGQETYQATGRNETTQINGIRDYVYGDKLSRVHWRATAKTGVWKSKEFEHESMPRTFVVLDCDKASYPNAQAFELAVSAAASMLDYGFRNRIHMGLYTLGQKIRMFTPSLAQGQWQEMMQHLVDVNWTQSEAAANYAAGLLETRSQGFLPGMLFVFISANTKESAQDILLRAKQRQLTPYYVQIGQTHASELMKRLALQGIRGASITSLQELPSAMGGGS